ncbi:MAG: hypothetical protein HQM09_03845 [Candidatus Riflebacteria bacterium]|nr:hypothetical protein [Candidatus Riflebacteria bacterium]
MIGKVVPESQIESTSGGCDFRDIIFGIPQSRVVMVWTLMLSSNAPTVNPEFHVQFLIFWKSRSRPYIRDCGFQISVRLIPAIDTDIVAMMVFSKRLNIDR